MDRAKVEMHLRACEECRAELDALRDVRVDLGSWSPPLPDLGFRIVRDAKPAARPSWRSWLTPAVGLAAAATLVFAAALSLAHIEIHNGPDGFTVRTGWSAAVPDATNSTGPIRRVFARDQFLPNDQMNPAGLAGIAQRVDALEIALRQSPVSRSAAVLSARASDEELIKRVRDMLARSEMKQQGELVLRIAQVVNAFDAQRKDDLARIQANFTNLQGTVTKEAAAHVDLVNYLTTAGKQK
jgi:hypothetical protein